MHIESFSIHEVFNEGRILRIPLYQRHYVWTRDKQWQPLWEDIKAKIIARTTKHADQSAMGDDDDYEFPTHFMGAAVLENTKKGDIKVLPEYEVVDGQQCLTTFQLFLVAARNYAIEAGFQKSAELIAHYIFNNKENRMQDPKMDKFKVRPTKADEKMFRNILSLDLSKLKKKYKKHFLKDENRVYSNKSTVPSMLGAYGFFFDRIKLAVEDEASEDFCDIAGLNHFASDRHQSDAEEYRWKSMSKNERFDAIWECFLKDFNIIEISLDKNKDDAQIIFETLNERGEPLLHADLVRNNIFRRAENKGADVTSLYDEHWKEFEDPFWTKMEKQGRYKRARIEFFLANFIAMKLLRDIKITNLFSEYKQFVKDTAYACIADEVGEMVYYARFYRRILERKTKYALGRFGNSLAPWDVTTVYPLVLGIWANKSIDKSIKKKYLKILETYIVRRAICGLTTKNYNLFFISVLRDITKHGKSLTESLLNNDAESRRFPTNTEFKNAWVNNPIYGQVASHRIVAVFEAIEISKYKEKYSEIKSTLAHDRNLTIEHIMPSDWAENWPLPNGNAVDKEAVEQCKGRVEDDPDETIKQIVKRQRLVNTIGNLSILTQSLNSKVSNAPYEKKKGPIKKYSCLKINKEITGHDSWDEEKIEKRSNDLFATALTIWPYPERE